MRALTSSLALAALLTIAGQAKADTTFLFTASGTGYSASGSLQGTGNGDGSYTITGITGTGITGLLAPNSFPSNSNDNLLFPSNTRTLDVAGLAFTQVIAGTTYQVNLFSNIGFNPPSNIKFFADTWDANGNFNESEINFTSTEVTPEPSTLLLLGTGVLGVATQLRRRIASA